MIARSLPDGHLTPGADPYPLQRGSEKAFVLGGRAVLTVVSRVTGTRFTYRVEKFGGKSDNGTCPIWFVSLLTGPDNVRDFTYIGTVFSSGEFRHTPKSKVDATAPGFVAFAWTWRNIDRLPDSVAVYHEGACSRCGRPLTDPESILSGLGPVCRARGAA